MWDSKLHKKSIRVVIDVVFNHVYNTENFDLEERIRALSDALHYFKQITFDFSSFNVSEKAESIKEMYNKNHKKQNDFGSQDY